MENEGNQDASLREEDQEEPTAEGGTGWKAMARKWERLAKSNSEKATAYDELAETRAKVAKDTGVPAELISGDDEESMRAFAEAVAKWGKPSSAPRTRKPGSFSADAGDGRDAAKRELARQLFGSGE